MTKKVFVVFFKLHRMNNNTPSWAQRMPGWCELFCNSDHLHHNVFLFSCVCVQALYVVLPGLLDCNPFPVDSSEPCWKGGVGFPEPVRRVLQVGMCIALYKFGFSRS